LTDAERRVARLVAEGLANREVAERLFLSRYTVETHLKHVFVKLGVSSRGELAALAARNT
jgi:DNA-binding CsgD family transcriptional regulator